MFCSAHGFYSGSFLCAFLSSNSGGGILTADLSLERGGTTLQGHHVLQRLRKCWRLSRHGRWHPEDEESNYFTNR